MRIQAKILSVALELYKKFCADLKEADETACENLK